MLKRFRIVGLCLVAVFAVSAVAVASASAANPEFYNCQKVAATTGEYPTKAACEKNEKTGEEPREWSLKPLVPVCTHASAVTGWPAFTKAKIWWWNKETAGKCETHEAPTEPFALGKGEYGESPFYSTLASGAAKPKLETVKGETVECETEKDIGEITAARSERTVVEFTGKCHSTTFGAGECHSSGEPEGTIVTNLLVGKPVYYGAGEKASEGVGIALEPASTEGERLFVSFECKTLLGTEHVKVGHAGGAGGDSIVCAITPINTITTTSTLTCAQTKGVQAYTKYYEGGTAHTDYLETEGSGPKTFPWEQSGQTTTSTVTAAEAGKIKA